MKRHRSPRIGGIQHHGHHRRSHLPNLALLRALRIEVLTASEAAILRAARDLRERMKIVVEPSGAVPLAVLEEHHSCFAGKRVGVILSGGNTDFRWLAR